MSEDPAAAGGQQSTPKLDTTVPQTARIWNHWLGGKDNFQVDREVYVDADLYDPGKVLGEAARTLDFTQPVGLMLMGTLGHIREDEEARSIVRDLLAALPSGSYLAIYDGTDTGPGVVEAARIWNQSADPQYHLRSPAGAAVDEIDQFCGVGRKR